MPPRIPKLAPQLSRWARHQHTTTHREVSTMQRLWQARPPATAVLFYMSFFTVIATFTNNVADITKVNGSSMYPFLNESKDESTSRDLVLDWKWSPMEDLERGMVVTFRSPTNPETKAVKRVIALEGDTVKTKKPYPFAEVKVPPGHIWVEGDGEKTLDSNTYGPISKRLLTGRATFILSPISKFGRIYPMPDESRLVR